MRKIIFILTVILVATTLHAAKIGDVIFNKDGSVGIVYQVNPDGISGMIVSLYNYPVPKKWGTAVDIPSINTYTMNVASDTTCYLNTKILRTYFASDTSYAASMVDFDKGWYLPTATQLYTITVIYPLIKTKLLAVGGDDFKADNYWSSSEVNANYALSCSFKPTDYDMYNHILKSTLGYVRAVHYFKEDMEIEYDTTVTYLWNTGLTTPYIKVHPATTTNYSVTITNKNGCSKSANKTIYVGENQTEIINAGICQGKAYRDHGFNESASGTYSKIVTSKGGCKLTLQLNLTVYPNLFTDIYDTIKAAYEYDKNGFNFTAPQNIGDYNYSQIYSMVNTCDSTVSLHLHVIKDIEKNIVDSICQGETYQDNGFNLAEQKLLGNFTYKRTIPVKSGCCDSTIVLHLTVTPATYSFANATINQGEYYNFNGRNYGVDGYYSAYLNNASGCDSIVTLRLVVLKTSSTTINDTICEGKSYSLGGKKYTEKGVYRDTLRNKLGLDSIVILNLFVNPVKTTFLSDSFCIHSTYSYRGNMINAPGVYIDTLVSSLGCDSIVTFTLTYRQAIKNTFNRFICEGDNYTFEGTILTSSGTYSKNYVAANGCDSIISLNLTVLKPETIYLNFAIKEGQSYLFGKKLLTTEGVYTDSLLSVHNCDSIVVLNLSVIKLVVVPDVFTPNNDGNNDKLIIKDIDKYPKNSLLVFNRWGNKVYEAKPYINDWDGTNQFGVTVGGKDLPVGTYFYILNLGDGSEAKKGFVYLNR